uniref:Partial AB-hydrolase lipase domain-containing protein n=1 Tax=Plectus sambesii TaxID=2011161 RepID=A0A914VS00_9BILA
MALLVFLMIAAGFFRLQSALVTNAKRAYDPLPEELMNTEQLIAHQEYGVQVHRVVTEDGYVLGMQRIACGRFASNCSAGRVPVLLMHGLAASSDVWVSDLYNQSLGFILADAGYDVWLGNCRGTSSSQDHISLSHLDPRYWEFSWEEMSDYDLPAMVDYIRNATAAARIHYVGHSQGTLIAFAKIADNPRFAEKIDLFFALAPVTTVGHITTPLRLLAPFASTIQRSLSLFGDRTLGHVSWVLGYVKPNCRQQTGWLDFCQYIIFFFAGAQDISHLDRMRMPVYLSHYPAETSMKNIVHFSQMVQSKQLARYDYGLMENLNHYLSFSPPTYDMSGARTKTVLFWSEQDAFASGLDVDSLMKKLPQYVDHRLDGFSHIDFLYASPRRPRLAAAASFRQFESFHSTKAPNIVRSRVEPPSHRCQRRRQSSSLVRDGNPEQVGLPSLADPVTALLQNDVRSLSQSTAPLSQADDQILDEQDAKRRIYGWRKAICASVVAEADDDDDNDDYVSMAD